MSRFIRLCLLLIVGFSLFSCAVPTIQNDFSIESAVVSSTVPTHASGTLARVSTPTSKTPTTQWQGSTQVTNSFTQLPTKSPMQPAAVLMQDDDTIPICKNAENPEPFSNLPGIEGKFFFASLDQEELFSFSSIPPQVMSIEKPKSWIDSYAFSDDGQLLLAYSKTPESLAQSPGLYPILIMDKDGIAQDKVIDLTKMTEFIHESGSDTFFAQRWEFKWVNSQVVQVAIGYGETSPHWFIFGYYDLLQDTWWNVPIQNVPNRNEYDWTDLSPDFTRLLYINVNWELVLWDLEKQEELWHGNPGNSNNPPLASWTTDSLEVVFWSSDKSDEIQLLNREGEGFFNVRKPIYPIKSQYLAIGYGFRWSPDNKFLAISGIIRDSQSSLKKPILYIYEAQSGNYIFRCPTGNSAERVNIWNFFWSPDGSMLIPEHFYTGLETTPFRLFDARNKIVYQYGQDTFSAIGWVKEFSDNWK